MLEACLLERCSAEKDQASQNASPPLGAASLLKAAPHQGQQGQRTKQETEAIVHKGAKMSGRNALRGKGAAPDHGRA
jgi:hypothetical protein